MPWRGAKEQRYTDAPKHTDTQIHSYPATQIHRYTDTQIHRYTDTQIHRYTDTQIHWFCPNRINTQIHWYTETLILHRYTDTQTHRYTLPKTIDSVLTEQSLFDRIWFTFEMPPSEPLQKIPKINRKRRSILYVFYVGFCDFELL